MRQTMLQLSLRAWPLLLCALLLAGCGAGALTPQPSLPLRQERGSPPGAGSEGQTQALPTTSGNFPTPESSATPDLAIAITPLNDHSDDDPGRELPGNDAQIDAAERALPASPGLSGSCQAQLIDSSDAPGSRLGGRLGSRHQLSPTPVPGAGGTLSSETELEPILANLSGETLSCLSTLDTVPGWTCSGPHPPAPSPAAAGEGWPQSGRGEGQIGPCLSAPVEAWSWQGVAATPLAPGAPLALAPQPTRLAVDLRGDGEPLWATLDAQGRVEVRDGDEPDAPLVWSNEELSWRITRIVAGDPNDDGRVELILLLWKPGRMGVLVSHPFLMGWRGGHYRIIWGGSATASPIQDLASADLDGDGHSELVVLEGGGQPGDPGEHIAVLHWHEWGFEYVWSSPAGRWSSLALQDLTGDALPEILAAQAS